MVKKEFSKSELIEFDKKHIWHPYTSMTKPIPAYPVESGDGVRLKLSDGRELVDGMSSWWAGIHGYNNPVLNKAAKDQIDKMSHVMFGGITHEPAVSLSSLLIDITPPPLDKVFLSDSGSVSIEVAIKMAIQYWYSKDQPEKNRLLTFRSGYHGDTFAAMSVCDPVNGMHEIFTHVLPKQIFADAPQCGFYDNWEDHYIDNFKNLIEENKNSLAAVILEPVVQGAGGMRFYHPQYLKKIRALCDEHNVLLIFDEIATGFGRSGKLFACEHSDVCPDIMCLGKSLTGGYMTMAATLATTDVGVTISEGGSGVFMHGPTFMGNPLACAVSKASIELLMSYGWENKVKTIEKWLENGLGKCRELDSVADVRVLGAIGVVETKEPVDMSVVQKAFVDKGVWIRPFGKLVYTMPPYIIEEEDMKKITDAIADVITNHF
ncbi:MAG: adenosylmethionine--8-amino-7-oxononanoate transaminase [Thermodesulfobacteriota bacterium]